MEYPLSEIIDRLTILDLKIERLRFDRRFRAEADLFIHAAAHSRATSEQIEEWYQRLKDINSRIWDLEAAIRREPGQEDESALNLTEIGRRALAIRAINGERIAAKNEIARAMGEFEEVKIDHASAE